MRYMETSALTQQGVKACFDYAVSFSHKLIQSPQSFLVSACMLTGPGQIIAFDALDLSSLKHKSVK